MKQGPVHLSMVLLGMQGVGILSERALTHAVFCTTSVGITRRSRRLGRLDFVINRAPPEPETLNQREQTTQERGIRMRLAEELAEETGRIKAMLVVDS